MTEVIISKNNHGIAWTLSQLIYSQVEFLFIGITSQIENNLYLVGDFIVQHEDGYLRFDYDHLVSSKNSFLLDSTADRMEQEIHRHIGRLEEILESDDPARKLSLPLSYQECAQKFIVNETVLEEIESYVKGWWSKGFGTVTIHNHPKIHLSYLNTTLREEIEVAYDILGSTIPFDKFTEQQLTAARRVPSEGDLEITRRLSNTGIGIIAVGRNQPKQGIYMGRIIDFGPKDFVGFKATKQRYNLVKIRHCVNETEVRMTDEIHNSFYACDGGE